MRVRVLTCYAPEHIAGRLRAADLSVGVHPLSGVGAITGALLQAQGPMGPSQARPTRPPLWAPSALRTQQCAERSWNPDAAEGSVPEEVRTMQRIRIQTRPRQPRTPGPLDLRTPSGRPMPY